MHQQFLHEVTFFQHYLFAIETIQRTDKAVAAIAYNDCRRVEIGSVKNK